MLIPQAFTNEKSQLKSAANFMELFFDLGQATQPLVPGQHNWMLVLLSYAIALLGAYTSLLTLTRASSYKSILNFVTFG